MATNEFWLAKLARLRVDRASGDPAPHKPLLLLAVLAFAERSILPPSTLPLSPEIGFEFYTYWAVVAHRRRQSPDVRLPFHHLQSDGIWSAVDHSNQPSDQFRTTKYAVMPADFVAFANDPASRERARRILIATYFRPSERGSLYAMFGLPVPSEDQISRDANFQDPDEAIRRGREARFRLLVIPAYNYTCALTGYRLTTISSGSIVDAAHIHPFVDSRNNDPTNGIALSKNAHWQFDRGLWTVADDFSVIVAAHKYSESSPDCKPLLEYHGHKLRLPQDKLSWPDLRHLGWHRKHRFADDA